MVEDPIRRLVTTMGWSFADGFTAIVHGEDTPAADDWDSFIAALADQPTKISQPTLVYSAGGGPNGIQRGQLEALMTETGVAEQVRVAVLTTSRLVRGIGTAVSWFQPHLKIFAPDQLDGAIAHLHLDDSDGPACRAELRALGHRLGVDVSPAVGDEPVSGDAAAQ